MVLKHAYSLTVEYLSIQYLVCFSLQDSDLASDMTETTDPKGVGKLKQDPS